MPSENSIQNPIHIRLDYLEALRARKALLSSELFSLNVAKKIAKYKVLRLVELDYKSKLYSKLKETKSNIKKLHDMLPNAKVPKILKKEHLNEKVSKSESKNTDEDSLEFQLREIQRRLEELQ